MSDNRIIYQNWIVELGRDPDGPLLVGNTSTESRSIIHAVRSALDRLTEEEEEFIVRFYFMGQTYRELCEETGREEYKLSSLHGRSIRKIRSLLTGFVNREFKLPSPMNQNCLLCRSGRVDEINALIASRDKTATWRGVIRELKSRFGIEVKTPQLLIGHEKYHMTMGRIDKEV